MSIKDNILYGNLYASDERVRQVAELANAIQFIERKTEDLDSEEARSHLIQEFKKLIKIHTKAYPNIKELEQV
jgi:ABC-type multidrug transport system fused ATPase/permease subunit